MRDQLELELQDEKLTQGRRLQLRWEKDQETARLLRHEGPAKEVQEV